MNEPRCKGLSHGISSFPKTSTKARNYVPRRTFRVRPLRFSPTISAKSSAICLPSNIDNVHCNRMQVGAKEASASGCFVYIQKGVHLNSLLLRLLLLSHHKRIHSRRSPDMKKGRSFPSWEWSDLRHRTSNGQTMQNFYCAGISYTVRSAKGRSGAFALLLQG